MKTYLLFCLFVFLSLTACGGKQDGPIATAVSPTDSAVSDVAEEGVVVEDEQETAVPEPTETTSAGQLYYVVLTPGSQELVRHDVDTDATSTLFTVPTNGWLANMDVSHDGKQIVMAYAPPPEDNGIQFGYSNLYVMLADGQSEPRELIPRENPEEILFNPIWSPLSTMIYYSHVTPTDPDSFAFDLTLERVNFVTGEVEILAENGIWPRVSVDNRYLAYIHSNPENQANALMLMELDRMTVTELVPETAFQAMDAPLFSADGQTIYFSAADNVDASRPWWDVLFGVETAVAHTLPSDWWKVSIDDPTPERLTTLDEVGLYADLSLDGQTIAFAAQGGLYRMNPDGSGVEKWVEETLTDALAWRR